MNKRQAAALYIVAQRHKVEGRLDAKTRGVKKCTPGNRRCGGRCIPREWACRLKGEGNDTHQRAAGKGRDPLSAAAHIQRGVQRVKKGFVTGNFSELEGGRRAIIRGVVKGSSKDLKEKKELQAKLVNATIGVAFLTGGAATTFIGHTRLMRDSTFYRKRVGGPLETSFTSSWNRALDALLPQRRLRASNARAAGVQGARTAAGIAQTTNPENVLGGPRIENLAANPPAAQGWGRNAISQAISDVKPGDYATKQEWHTASIRSLWGVKRTKDQVIGGVSESGYFMSTLASEELLRSRYGVADSRIKGGALIKSMADVMESQNTAIRAYAKDRGINLESPRQRRKLAEDLTDFKLFRNAEVRAAAIDYVDELAAPKLLPTTLARKQYRLVNDNYDRIIKGALDEFEGSIYNAKGKRVARSSLATRMAEGHAEYLAQAMYKIDRGTRFVRGPATTDLVIEHYYSVLRGGTLSGKAARETRWTANNIQITRAAQEFTGRRYTDPAEALNDLHSIGAFPSLRLRSPSGGAGAGATPPEGGGLTPRRRGRPARRAPGTKSAEEIAQTYLRSGRYKSPEAARRAAEAYVREREVRKAKRNSRGDAVQQRLDAPQAQGRACGKAFIARQKKCHKPVSVTRKPQEPKKSSTPVKAGGTAVKAVGGAAAVAGAAALGVAGFRKRRSIGAYTRFTPKVMNAAITRMSQKDVQNGINKMPERFRGRAAKLVGKAKVAAAAMSADAQGYNVVKVDNKRNYSTWRNDKLGKTTSIGSVGDSLVMFNTTRTGRVDAQTAAGRGLDVIDMDFQVDLGFQQKNVSRQAGMDTVKTVKAMYETSKTQLPRNALLRNVPYGKDSKGARRASLYKRAGFKNIRGVRGEAQFALFNDGKVEAIPDQYEDLFADLIKGESYEEALKRWQAKHR